MIGYLDRSAFAPLLVDEPTTPGCLRFWRAADAVLASRLTYVETAAALAQAVRAGRLSARTQRRSLVKLDELWAEFEVVEVDRALARRAADLADRVALRGYDALHCASAEQIDEPDVVAATGDHALLAAWRALGVATCDANRQD